MHLSLREIADLVLQTHPELVRLHAQGKAVLGRTVGLILEKAPRGTSPDEAKIIAVEALLMHGQGVLIKPSDQPVIHTPSAPDNHERLTVFTADVKTESQPLQFNATTYLPGDPRVDEGLNLERWGATDLADRYRTSHARQYVQKGETDEEKRWGWMSIPVLEFLNGRPWDNAALNLVRALRPTSIRVTTGCVTCDNATWRVTVFLQPSDDRTIEKIEQEVEVGLVGCRYGADVSDYIAGRTPPKARPQCIFNPRGLKS